MSDRWSGKSPIAFIFIFRLLYLSFSLCTSICKTDKIMFRLGDRTVQVSPKMNNKYPNKPSRQKVIVKSSYNLMSSSSPTCVGLSPYIRMNGEGQDVCAGSLRAGLPVEKELFSSLAFLVQEKRLWEG